MDTSFAIFVLVLAAMIVLTIVIGELSSRSDYKDFELADIKFRHVILKSKDVFVKAASTDCGTLNFIDKMTFDEIRLSANYELFGRVQINESYNLTVKGNKIIDIREEDF